ncbi:MAG TPA: response regulator [Bryobacteraceae bacterium]|nr:response regulator [Bryobacteraceae bacterium]
MPHTHQPKIVIVEDEGLIAADLESRLKAGGYSVPGIADSAHTALEVIEKTAPDLVLMDIRLKGAEDGIEAAGLVRKKLDVPVIYLTAYEDPGTLERASATQAYGYIKKPIASASLKGAIEIAISKHRHEGELREQRDWALASFAAVPYAVLVTDGFGRITYLNSQAEQLTGWSADQALGRPSDQVLRLFSREAGRPVHDVVRVAMLNGEPVPLPDGVCLKGRGERIYAIEGNVAPRWRDGRLEGAVLALTDVTLCRFGEDQSRQESKQEALARMAAGVVRHLPDLGALAEESSRLLEGLPVDSPLRARAQKIEKAAMDAFATACHLRAFLEPPDLHLEPILLNDVVARFQEAFQIMEPGFAVLADPEPMPVQVDEWHLIRAVLNVLLHARSRRQPGTGLVMDLSSAEPELIGHWARLGITYVTADENAAALESIFEPSWSGPSEDLHITHGLLKRMGGLVSARLERGDTVRFEIYLPRVEAVAGAQPVPTLDKPAILLIEPDPEISRILHVHFEKHGHNLLETHGCEEALLLAELYQGPIPLVIANPASNDPARARLAERLAAIDPAMRLRLLENYSEPREPAHAIGDSPPLWHLTKWDLLGLAKEALGSAKPAICSA